MNKKSNRRRDDALERTFRQLNGQQPDTGVSDYHRRQRRKILLICVAALLAVALLAGGIFTWYLFDSTKDDGRIFSNVWVQDVNLGGMTPEEATLALEQQLQPLLQQTLILQLPDTTLEFTPESTKVSLDISALVDAAYSYGRSGSRWQQAKARSAAALTRYELSLLDYLTLDTDFIRRVLTGQNALIASTLTQPVITVSGERPQDPSSSTVTHQTLVVTMGTPERYLDTDAVYTRILDAYSTLDFTPIATDYYVQEPNVPDLGQAWLDYCQSAVNASLDPDTFEITDEAWGYGFDYEVATVALANASEGAVVEIPMDFLEPAVTREDLMSQLFQDVLGTYTSTFTSAANSNYNARLAASKVNGTIVLPGQTFSFNQTVGERTEAGGYKTSASYLNGKTIQTVGGGVCHTSSDLYYVALLSGMTILERSEHAYVAPYVPVGLDATVSWGQLDMKFRNDTNYPIQILIETSDKYMTVTFMGTEERDYYIRLDSTVTHIDKYETVIGPAPEDEVDSNGDPIVYQPGDIVTTGINGITAEAFISRVDRETGKVLSRESLGTSQYVRRDEYIVEEPEVPTEPTQPETQPTTPPTEATTPPTEATTPPTEATTPPTEATTPPTEATTPPTEATTPPTEATEPSTEPTAPSAESTDPSSAA